MTQPNAGTFGRYLFGKEYRERPLVRAASRVLHREDVRFSVRFALLASGAWLLYVGLARRLAPAADASTAVVVWSANLLGMDAASFGQVVSFGGGSYWYRVDLGCTGLFVGVLFVAALLAYPATGGQRALGLAFGLPALFAVNLARLLSMGWLGIHHPSLVESAHLFWWQAFLLLVTGIGWLAWIRLVVERPHGESRWARAAELLRAAGAFVALLLGFAALGAWLPVGDAYAALVHHAALALLPLVGASEPAAPALSTIVAYGTAASAAALFLATPRESWRRRMRGAAAWGVLACFLVQVALSLGMHAVGTQTDLTGALGILTLGTLQMVVPVAAWYAWARRRGLLPEADAARRYACPECGVERLDVLAHVHKAHAPRAHAVVRALVRRHPELREETGR